ncbi:DUF4383 domain-containing protein [Candidatus Nitrospira nitrificans]|jgi:hypothetical protein|uniref:DUF4383 domain-containing protein n=1 Tax=Candidatus Nitrospira nitrificans TaxID=1742973 RepID=A0A0S4LQ63_9BACT|nr:DUF4383 domain-containing protein [Candidatus Nitrospira nitrificans]CUS39687.1 conserved membrane hypothetical protein [Candidatus Nitrospira nitrificans]
MTSRTFAQIIGVLFLAVGVMGFIPLLVSTPHPNAVPGLSADDGYGLLFGLFPVNWIHNLVHLGVGIAGLSAASSVSKANGFARGLAWLYGILTVMGTIPLLSMTFGLVPLHGWDVWLHGGTAAFAAYFGYGKRAQAAEIAESYHRAA